MILLLVTICSSLTVVRSSINIGDYISEISQSIIEQNALLNSIIGKKSLLKN